MAANGQNGGVSRRRLPTKPMELPAEEPKQRAARFKVGDRVSLAGGAPRGIVRETARGKAFVHWGTADNKEVTSWVPTRDLEKTKERVVDPDEVIKRQKQ